MTILKLMSLSCSSSSKARVAGAEGGREQSRVVGTSGRRARGRMADYRLGMVSPTEQVLHCLWLLLVEMVPE